METAAHSGQPGPAESLRFSGVSDILPRLRSLVRARGYARNAICQYCGLHTNTLQRLFDPKWHPRSDTLARLESFLADSEGVPDRRLSGFGWALAYREQAWWVDRRNETAMGPYDDPNLALAVAERFYPNKNLPEIAS